MEPIIIGALVIVIVIALGVLCVVYNYRNRTHTPSINVEGVLDGIIPKPPQ